MKKLRLFALLLPTVLFSITFPATAQPAESPGEGVWANYDFVPGHRVLAFHDFEDAYVGNFPDRVTYEQGDAEIVKLQDGNQVLRTKNEARFLIPMQEPLPEKFTVEYRVSATDKRSKVMMYSPTEKNIKSPGKLIAAMVDPAGSGLTVGKYNDGPKATQKLPEKGFLHHWIDVRIAVDGAYWKMYVDEKRVANIPKVDFPKGDGLAFYMSVYPYDDGDVYIDDIRIAAGGRSILYEAIAANGVAITHGILFDLNSAALRPESTPTLDDMAKMLKAHTDLKLRIEGHTDNSGSAEINQPLSQQRAEAVKKWLVEKRAIDASRLVAEGIGATKPVASNDTAEGRQENRRVELHRID